MSSNSALMVCHHVCWAPGADWKLVHRHHKNKRNRTNIHFFFYHTTLYRYSLMDGLPWWFRWERICLQCRRNRFYACVGKIPWRREWQPIPVFLPGEFHWQRSMVGYRSWVAKSQTWLSDWTRTWVMRTLTVSSTGWWCEGFAHHLTDCVWGRV